MAGLALLLGGITIWYAWVVARHLRDDARQTSTLLGRVFAGLNDPRPDAATDALLDLARQVRSLGIAIVVMDTAGHITALDNAPPQIGADTARLRAWNADLDDENAPLVQPGVGTIHYGTGTAARRFASIAALEGAVDADEDLGPARVDRPRRRYEVLGREGGEDVLRRHPERCEAIV